MRLFLFVRNVDETLNCQYTITLSMLLINYVGVPVDYGSISCEIKYKLGYNLRRLTCKLLIKVRFEKSKHMIVLDDFVAIILDFTGSQDDGIGL